FQTAYLKAHFPTDFYAAVLSHEADDSTKVYKYSTELRSVGLKLLPPDVDESGDNFTPLDDAVRFGLGAIKGIGSSTIEAIVEARRDGKFLSFFDFVKRIDAGAINRRGLEGLIASGSFDSMKPEGAPIGKWRANLCRAIEPALAFSLREHEDKRRGQTGLFAAAATAQTNEPLPDVEPWSQTELCRQEKSALGFYLSVHPLDSYKTLLENLAIRNIGDYEEIKAGDFLTLAGIVSDSQIRYSKKGNRFCTFRIEDQSTSVKCLAWAEAYSKFGRAMTNDEVVIVEGKIESIEGIDITFIVLEARLVADAVAMRATGLSVNLPANGVDDEYLSELLTIFNRETGKCDLYLDLRIDNIDVRLLSKPVRIKGSTELENELKSRGCKVEWLLK
ncbi:MAG: hypothetical protein LC734_03915, partial [Acidobacteria bacterium]|nr:hypothetical protein [Acidobacteriota bacterium]